MTLDQTDAGVEAVYTKRTPRVDRPLVVRSGISHMWL